MVFLKLNNVGAEQSGYMKEGKVQDDGEVDSEADCERGGIEDSRYGETVSSSRGSALRSSSNGIVVAVNISSWSES